MYKEKEDAKRERGDNEKRIKREEREKKRKLNEELKMKRMQERITVYQSLHAGTLPLTPPRARH